MLLVKIIQTLDHNSTTKAMRPYLLVPLVIRPITSPDKRKTNNIQKFFSFVAIFYLHFFLRKFVFFLLYYILIMANFQVILYSFLGILNTFNNIIKYLFNIQYTFIYIYFYIKNCIIKVSWRYLLNANRKIK